MKLNALNKVPIEEPGQSCTMMRKTLFKKWFDANFFFLLQFCIVLQNDKRKSLKILQKYQTNYFRKSILYYTIVTLFCRQEWGCWLEGTIKTNFGIVPKEMGSLQSHPNPIQLFQKAKKMVEFVTEDISSKMIVRNWPFRNLSWADKSMGRTMLLAIIVAHFSALCGFCRFQGLISGEVNLLLAISILSHRVQPLRPVL